MTPLWWAGLAAAVVFAAWWLWPRLKLKDRSSGEVYILNVLGALTMLWVCIVGINFTDGWWLLPFWIVGIPAAIATGLLLGLAVIVTAVELDLRDDERMNLTLRRVEGGDEL